jgi:hypothetical protein
LRLLNALDQDAGLQLPAEARAAREL